MNLHIAVSEQASLYGFFNKPSFVCSHFYVRRDGQVEQYVDTAYKAAADYQGNSSTISIETQGMADGEWTSQQLNSMAALFAWARDAHGLANKLATNSQPNGDSSHGLSWHRLGIDGNFPASGILAGRLQLGGGLLYSPSRGKVCPTSQRILQISQILSLSNGGNIPVYTGTPDNGSSYAATGKLDVDGVWGPNTTRSLEHAFGTPEDGVISAQYVNSAIKAIIGVDYGPRKKGGSTLVKAMQAWLGVSQDGWLGPITITALQNRLGTPADGFISTGGSTMVTRMQERLNAGTLLK